MNRGLEAMGGRIVKRWRVYERERSASGSAARRSSGVAADGRLPLR